MSTNSVPRITMVDGSIFTPLADWHWVVVQNSGGLDEEAFKEMVEEYYTAKIFPDKFGDQPWDGYDWIQEWGEEWGGRPTNHAMLARYVLYRAFRLEMMAYAINYDNDGPPAKVVTPEEYVR